MSQDAQRTPLAVVNANIPTRLKPPTKVTKADFPVQTIDSVSAANDAPTIMDIEAPTAAPTPADAATLKRKKTEADLKESLRQRKMLNTTMDAGTASSVVKKKPAGSSSLLNQTVDISGGLGRPTAASARRVAPAASLNATTSRTTTAASKARAAATTAARTTTASAAKAAAGSDKRPPWDLKGRLEDTEKSMSFLKTELNKYNFIVDKLKGQLEEKESAISHISEAKVVLESDVGASRKELQQLINEKLDLQNQMIMVQTESNLKIQDLMMKNQSLDNLQKSTSQQLEMKNQENTQIKLMLSDKHAQYEALRVELDLIKSQLAAAQTLAEERAKKITELNIIIDHKNTTISELEAQVREDEQLRKKLHNQIQELKGNIRVFCRLRPFLGDEVKEHAGAESMYEFPANNDKALEISTSCLTGPAGKTVESKKFNFAFDKVFQPSTSQAKVFDEISQLVQSALDGYNTCIFAYGQTGSGKTYTMEGAGYDAELEMPLVDNERRGMIPRAVEQIYATAHTLKDKGWEYEMEAMFLEIYNETINDLLTTKHNPDTKYEIKHDSKGNTSVTNLTTVKVRSPSQVYELLRRASKNRSVGRTNMNERSSRSHSVFQLKLSGTNTITGENCNGILNLIDLAGSERLDQSGATGQRLVETQHINKSLTHLGDVIAALASKAAHIPYRNSKLTYLLQNCLGGNSKTLMFVNISPRPSDLNETISSLRFATKVNSCEIGTAKRQTKVDFGPK